MKKLRIAYFGTPDFAAHFLEKLLTDAGIPVEVVLVVTQEDKPVGRRQLPTPSPVKTVAEKFNIQVWTLAEALYTSEVKEIDLALLFAYGELIPPALLQNPRYGFWNIHPSLLPNYRGPSPVTSAIIAGSHRTGVTLMKMTEQMDEGPIIAQKALNIGEKERRPELTMRLTNAGYDLFNKATAAILERAESGQAGLTVTSQDEAFATYTKRIRKEDGFIEISNFKFQISNSPERLFNRFRGLYPWPGIWTFIKLNVKRKTSNGIESRLKITDMDLVDGKLIIKKVQLEGKKEVDFETFKRAYEIDQKR